MKVTVLVEGTASGDVLALSEPVSFWGGVDPASGAIIDIHHPQQGEVLTGKVLVMGHGKGSSGASAVLSEAIRLGTAPVAIVLDTPDPLIALGSVAAAELYNKSIPVVVVNDITTLTGAETVSIHQDQISVTT
jgi:predicted aconitase with swiveling domain